MVLTNLSSQLLLKTDPRIMMQSNSVAPLHSDELIVLFYASLKKTQRSFRCIPYSAFALIAGITKNHIPKVMHITTKSYTCPRLSDSTKGSSTRDSIIDKASDYHLEWRFQA